MNKKKYKEQRGKIAILILNFNCEQFLQRCLDSFLKQKNHERCDIYLIDNASSDRSVTLVKEKFPLVYIVKNKQNLGTSNGFNIVLSQVFSKYEYVGFFNSDIILEKNWLKITTKVLDNNSDVGICTGLILDWKGNNVENAGGTILNLIAGIFGGFLANIRINQIPKKYLHEEFPVFFGVITAMLVRADTLKKIGLFSNNYFMCFEDIDLSWRVLLLGQKVLCSPQARVRHYLHGSNPNHELSLKLLKESETNLLLTYYKNLSSGLFLIISVPLVITRFIMSLGYIFISPRVCIYKFSGIITFIKGFVKGSYREDRFKVTKIRKISDMEVLTNNPVSLFSFTSIFFKLPEWALTIKKALNQSLHADL